MAQISFDSALSNAETLYKTVSASSGSTTPQFLSRGFRIVDREGKRATLTELFASCCERGWFSTDRKDSIRRLWVVIGLIDHIQGEKELRNGVMLRLLQGGIIVRTSGERRETVEYALSLQRHLSGLQFVRDITRALLKDAVLSIYLAKMKPFRKPEKEGAVRAGQCAAFTFSVPDPKTEEGTAFLFRHIRPLSKLRLDRFSSAFETIFHWA